jgi:hypothetical protein
MIETAKLISKGVSPLGGRPSRQGRNNSLVVVDPDGNYEVFGAPKWADKSIFRVAPLSDSPTLTRPTNA